jgi:hypothetical protein
MACFMVVTVRTNLTPMAQIFPPAYFKPLFIWTVSHTSTLWRTRFGRVYEPVMWQDYGMSECSYGVRSLWIFDYYSCWVTATCFDL